MKKLISILSMIFILSIVFFMYARYIEPNFLKVHYENIESMYISKGSRELKILQFSDMHVSEYFDENDMEMAVEKINEQNPDIVVFTGDLIDQFNNYENKDNVHKIWESLAEINASIGKYAIYGNHDYGGGAEQVYRTIIENSGFILLKNEKITLEDYNINIIGMDDSIFGKFEKDKLISFLDKDSFNIVLSHEPDVIDYLLEYNIDLFLSGHSHGGQINLPLVNSFPLLAKKYTNGIYSFDNYRQTILYVNVGLGTSQLPLRFMAPPELSVFKLNNNEK